MSKYDELRKVAEAATPGPWHSQQDAVMTSTDWQLAETYRVPQDRNAAYIAAVSPDVILALLDERERLRDLIYRWKDVYERGFLNSDFQPLYDETFDMLDGRPVKATQ